MKNLVSCGWAGHLFSLQDGPSLREAGPSAEPVLRKHIAPRAVEFIRATVLVVRSIAVSSRR
jgi:hypothetical protein